MGAHENFIASNTYVEVILDEAGDRTSASSKKEPGKLLNQLTMSENSSGHAPYWPLEYPSHLSNHSAWRGHQQQRVPCA